MSKKIFTTLFAIAFVVIAAGSSWAVSGYLSSFTSTYPSSGTSSFSCSICHTSVPTRNAYGTAYANAGHSFTAIESADSDGDGFTNIAEINAGTNPGDPASKPATPPPPPPPAACTYTYSAWSACQPNGTQTRTVISSSPAGCVGTPVLSQACTYVPPVTTCTSWTYSAWSACQPNGTQTRTVISGSPAGCTGNPPASQLAQACTYVPPVMPCTSYTYTLGACQPDGTAPVTSAVGVPAGCSGGATPATTQPCTYVPPTPPPPPTSGVMPLPTGEEEFSYDPVEQPVLSDVPAEAKPIGFGPAAVGGDMIDARVAVGPFAGPVDVSVVIYAPAVAADDLFFVSPVGGLGRLSDAVREDEDAVRNEWAVSGFRNGPRPHKKFKKLVLWKKGVTEVNETIFTAPVSDLPAGKYTLVLTASPANSGDDDDTSYRWETQLKLRSNNR